jgi:hypothetical protein
LWGHCSLLVRMSLVSLLRLVSIFQPLLFCLLACHCRSRAHQVWFRRVALTTLSQLLPFILGL